MAFNYNKLRGKIREKFIRQDEFAKAIGMSKTTLSQKLNNVTQFTQKEIVRAMNALDLPYTEVDAYFFSQEIQKTVQTQNRKLK